MSRDTHHEAAWGFTAREARERARESDAARIVCADCGARDEWNHYTRALPPGWTRPTPTTHRCASCSAEG